MMRIVSSSELYLDQCQCRGTFLHFSSPAILSLLLMPRNLPSWLNLLTRVSRLKADTSSGSEKNNSHRHVKYIDLFRSMFAHQTRRKSTFDSSERFAAMGFVLPNNVKDNEDKTMYFLLSRRLVSIGYCHCTKFVSETGVEK